MHTPDRAWFLDRIYIDPSGCWAWKPLTNHLELPGGVRVTPAQFAWLEWKGAPAPTRPLRTCGFSRCCNPEHLEARLTKVERAILSRKR